ncbi:hypothetical protein AX774_g109 [Zancudomyces culisetae]|uniref:Uncharacterized protein n=1 Tax=Zancudomyces culisetae TaxID=1213189 RepID=A0A1R1PZ49_ZANCU|nr:hypothetical protein AX774_g109 [Zancudomyces culisetae]|eukprot:OMH86219.1 hypothetical protein AX774_g109 [Zancudomyces culisetae]
MDSVVKTAILSCTCLTIFYHDIISSTPTPAPASTSASACTLAYLPFSLCFAIFNRAAMVFTTRSACFNLHPPANASIPCSGLFLPFSFVHTLFYIQQPRILCPSAF